MNILRKTSVCIFLIWITVLSAFAEMSLYEKYAKANEADLKHETQDIMTKIQDVFNEKDIQKKQAAIDFAEYFSNFKSLIYFANKLAIYASYETDLKFGKDKDLFKGLPDEQLKTSKTLIKDNQIFIQAKYEKMKNNIQAEIKTYDDMAKICLEACISKSEDDAIFKETVLQHHLFEQQLIDFFETKAFQLFIKNKQQLNQFRPNLVKHIGKQVSLWKTSLLNPDAPIINPVIVNALSG